MQYEYEYKATIVGRKNVGKTKIVSHLSGKPIENISNKSSTTAILTIDEGPVKLELWKIEGMNSTGEDDERGSFLKDAKIVIFVYDVTNEDSFEFAKQQCKGYKNSLNLQNSIVLLLANEGLDQINLENKNYGISSEIAESFATEHGMHFNKISTLTGTNILQSVIKITKYAMYPSLDPSLDLNLIRPSDTAPGGQSVESKIVLSENSVKMENTECSSSSIILYMFGLFKILYPFIHLIKSLFRCRVLTPKGAPDTEIHEV